MTKDQLIQKAQSLGIQTEGLTVEQLKGVITTTLKAKKAELEDNASAAKAESEELEESAPEDAKQAAQAKLEAANNELSDFLTLHFPAKNQAAAPEQDKTSFSYEGKEYRFTRRAPERFNFVGKNKTQAEWLQDEVAMGLLIEGNSSYIEPLND